MHTVGCLCSRATNFAKKEISRKQFSRICISLQSAIHVTIGFPISFGETNLWKSEKSTKSTKFVALKKGALQYK